MTPLETWAGVECTMNRVGDRWIDQAARSGHDARLDDLDRFAALGVTALRVPVLWERLAPASPDAIDWRLSDARLGRLRELGIRPIVGLVHHGSGPAYTSLVDDRFPALLAGFARAVAARYPWVTDFTPINEPLTTARFSGLYGHWFPHGRDDRTFVRALLQQLRGVALAMHAIREVTPDARLVQTEDCGRTLGIGRTLLQVEHEAHRRWLTWDLLTGRVDAAHPMRGLLRRGGATRAELAAFVAAPCPPAILGLNYYVTSDRYLDARLDRYPATYHGGNGTLRYADVEAVRARPDGIVGHEEHLLAAWTRYELPVAITEVHLGCTRDEQLRWLAESWHAAQRARARGADVRAVTAWALLGSYDWDSLVTRDAGHYEPGVFDIRSPQPRPTALVRAVRAMAEGRAPEHPVLAGPGWWRRPDRLLHAGKPQPSSAAGPPLLVIGATGTLGYAFHRLCTARGLACRLVGRAEVDITDTARIDAVLRATEPWAVINAAGYVRVDDAEAQVEACHRANVQGPVNLAAACRRRGLPFVTFSSDLVFDGAAGRAYDEGDTPRPLNVYGASKAEMETRVRDVLPDALVIRTSAFFGPWDGYNFLAGLFQTLDDGGIFEAPGDSVVSPTYVPDLVHATLDLLIDGERGIWHLANAGAVTWHELARVAAARSGRPADRIRAVPTAAVWGPAVRPAHTPLTSARGSIMRPLEAALDTFVEARQDFAPGRNRSCVLP